MPHAPIGDQELALLQHLAEREPVTVGEMATSFGQASGLARSTVLTMMERLRTKGYLKRRQSGGVYRYSATTGPGEAMRSAVGQFVARTLSGSVSPFVAWMAERGEVSDDELAQLQALVKQLKTARKET
jgi:predicted transcriptional regulator